MKKYLFILFFLHFFSNLHNSAYAQDVKSSGTGFFVSANGIIITCAHVLEDGARIMVKTDNNEYPAQVLAKNTNTDLAILKINYRNPYHFKIANFNTSSLGDKVYVLGFPLSDILGSDIRLTDGIVSAKSGINSDQNYFQLSAPIQPGNSGGPIINSRFEVIGIAAHKLNEMAILAASGSIPQNVNFGVKSEHINPLRGDISLGNGNVRNMDNAANATVHILNYEERTQQTGSTINIVNKTGYTIFYIYLSPVSSDSWGLDRLGSGVLINNNSFSISSLPLNVTNRYDIRIVDEDNDSYTKRNVLLSPNQNIEFTINDYDSRSPATTNNPNRNLPTVRITNKTGYTVFYVYISPASSSGWEEDVMGDKVLLNERSVNVRLAKHLNEINRYDVRLIDSDGDTYTKWNVLITPNINIEFTIRDID